MCRNLFFFRYEGKVLIDVFNIRNYCAVLLPQLKRNSKEIEEMPRTERNGNRSKIQS